MAQTPIKTSLTRLLGIRTPLVSAAMAGASGGELAARVSKAGGFGFIGTGYEPVSKLKHELDLARSILASPSPSPLRIGVGFLGWTLDKNPQARELIAAALEERVKAVWFFAGNDLGKWIDFVRTYDRERGYSEDEENKTQIFVQINSVEEAAKAAEKKVDVIVAQGIEAGGHGHSKAPPLLTLLPSIIRYFNGVSDPAYSPILLASGGLTTGSHLASLLSLGAQGIVVGTRFLATPSSLYTPAQKDSLVAASSNNSVRSFAFDVVRGTTGWPEDVDGRGLDNKVFKDEGDSKLTVEDKIRRYKEGIAAGDSEYNVTWAGASVGLVEQIQAPEDIVNEIHDEAVVSLQAASQTVF